MLSEEFCEAVIEKTCSVCKEMKPLNAYYKRYTMKDEPRFSAHCKPCNHERTAKWGREYREKIKKAKMFGLVTMKVRRA